VVDVKLRQAEGNGRGEVREERIGGKEHEQALSPVIRGDLKQKESEGYKWQGDVYPKIHVVWGKKNY